MVDANKNPKSSSRLADAARASRRWFSRHRRTIAWVGAGALVVGVVAFAAFRFRAQPSKAGLADAVKRAKKEPKAYAAQRDLGHSQYASGQRAQALHSYERALKLNEEAADGRMIDNLVACFHGPEQAEAAALIVRYKMVDATNGLQTLTRDQAHATRWAAIDTLEKLGKVRRADMVNGWHRDLEDPAASCDARRRAVEMLGDYDSGQEAVPALRAAKKRDQKETPWYKRSCLGSRPEDAEKKILARSGSPKKGLRSARPPKKA